ncbi:glutamine cyclotransferase [Lutibacter sp. Hel_I_33_5]|uniref:glutaminyl-peptide cyclotransferase n=1 Tax=Lutibacter sp. Hel_I_33_5 TaxID=1566289 RepID=UPI0011A98354|nr:glutaminyl-peptide cyclotransferase [Lutibacter sp. Hel_I_33_5]TVZ57035.1 glutamine cyclotransferase [Lutibacter sp. Hel_I_33_5]
MKILTYFFILLLTAITLSSCETTYKFSIEVPKKTTIGKTVTATLKEKNNNPIDSVQFFLNGKQLASKNNSITINTESIGVGKQYITALTFYPGKTKKTNNSFEIFANKAPEVYGYKLINTYPHDAKAYTQGLEYHNGYLYETTGRKGQSTLRKVDIKSGKVIQKIDLDKKYFGEGMTIVKDKIFWLTWQAKKGFVYNLNDFKQVGEFNYNRSKEGWGLTHNATELIKTDGSHNIWFLNQETQKEKRKIQAYTNKYAVDKLNEAEFFNGKLYINRWMTEKPVKSIFVIVNPENGVVEGLANLNGLRKEVLKSQKLEDDDVLNGIAFDNENNRLFVTGKHWSKLFEIELVKKQ